MNAKKRIEKFRHNPKLKIFLAFLILSFIYWFFSELSELYKYEMQYKIQYTNIPEHLFFQTPPPQTINLQIEASGFEILWHKLFPKELSIDVSNFKKLHAYNYYFLPNENIIRLEEQDADVHFVRFIKDSIFLSLGSMLHKKIPVRAHLSLQYTPGYKLVEPLVLQPDSIEIKGPKIYIDTLQSISTQARGITDINSNFEIELPLYLPEMHERNIEINIDHVLVKAKVSKFTEAQKELEILVPKLKDAMEIELYPKIAVVKYEIAFDKYKSIDETSFIIACNYPAESKDSTNQLKLYLKKKPVFVKNYSIEPQFVNYLLKKK